MRVLLALLVLCGFLNSASAQTLNPGDTLEISVVQDPNLNRKVLISPNGTIAFPLAGHLKASGLTLEGLEAELKRRLQKNYTGALDITVALAAANKDEEDQAKPRVYITGEVARPGPYIIKPQVNVVQAIALAGGLGPFAARKRIQVHRKIQGADSILLFDYNAFQAGADVNENINLRSGDVIIVPERGLFE